MRPEVETRCSFRDRLEATSKIADHAKEPRELAAGFHIYFYKIIEFNQREPLRRRSHKRAMAGQAQKRRPPHLMADEHFNPPAAD
jgi:hypothetical protein